MNAVTIVAMLGELIETHQDKCEQMHPPVPHIISTTERRAANITKVQNVNNLLLLDLDDGSKFTITVEQTL